MAFGQPPAPKPRPQPSAPGAPAPPRPPTPGAAPPAAPGAAPGVPPQQPVVDPTPGKKVKFKHPQTGAELEGHIHGQPGALGATIVDGTGATHKIPHGGYMHAEDDDDGPERKPQGRLVAAAARKHLELGMDQPLAVLGTAALLVIGGVKTAHKLQAGQVKVDGDCLYVKPDKLKTDDEAVVNAVRELLKRSSGPLFKINGRPITPEDLTHYVRRFGTPTGPISPQQPAPASATEQAMAKAVASALDLPDQGQVVDRWNDDGYACSLRKSGNGLLIVSIQHASLPVPLHEIVAAPHQARPVAHDAVVELRAGRAPPRFVAQAVAQA